MSPLLKFTIGILIYAGFIALVCRFFWAANRTGD